MTKKYPQPSCSIPGEDYLDACFIWEESHLRRMTRLAVGLCRKILSKATCLFIITIIIIIIIIINIKSSPSSSSSSSSSSKNLVDKVKVTRCDHPEEIWWICKAIGQVIIMKVKMQNNWSSDQWIWLKLKCKAIGHHHKYVEYGDSWSETIGCHQKHDEIEFDVILKRVTLLYLHSMHTHHSMFVVMIMHL